MGQHDRPLPYRKNVEESSTTGFVITGRLYDFLKFLALIFLPAVATLYFALSSVWHFPDAQNVVGSIVAFDTFLGAILGVSASNFKNSGGDADGNYVVEERPDGKRVYSLELNDGVEDQLHEKSQLTFNLVQK